MGFGCEKKVCTHTKNGIFVFYNACLVRQRLLKTRRFFARAIVDGMRMKKCILFLARCLSFILCHCEILCNFFLSLLLVLHVSGNRVIAYNRKMHFHRMQVVWELHRMQQQHTSITSPSYFLSTSPDYYIMPVILLLT